MNRLPLLRHHERGGPVAWYQGQPIPEGRFLGDVANLAETLPDRGYVVNLCEDRYRFLVGFAAAMTRGQVTLLPPSRAPQAVADIARTYPGTYCLADSGEGPEGIETVRLELRSASLAGGLVPAFDADLLVAILFTSGSTGVPKANGKTWGSLVRGAELAGRRFLGGSLGKPGVVVGTVPAQHMYGLEMTVLLPIQTGLALHGGRPFYPADVKDVLEALPAERILVTTPVHCRALVNGGASLPDLRFAISSTAPLAPSLAVRTEALLKAPVLEVYGCTEAGSVATRRTAMTELWQPYPGIRFEGRLDGQWAVGGGHLNAPVLLNDRIELRGETGFLLRGRHGDLIKIAGKRASLGDLNHQLNSIDGVLDGVFFVPDDPAEGTLRLTAFAVAPGLTAEQVLQTLRLRIDPVFLPRPLILVDALPRTETGKLPRNRMTEWAAHWLKAASV